MSTRKFARTILVATLGTVALTVATAASAHDDHDRWRWEPRGPEYYWPHPHHHHRHYYPEIVREPIFVREAPPVVYGRPAYYHSPAIVIGVDVPPLVIPLR